MSNLSAQDLGLKSIGNIQHNLSYEELFEQEKQNNEGAISANGTMMVDTGKFTGRSPKDKYFVHQKPSFENIAWGKINQAMAPEVFDELYAEALLAPTNEPDNVETLAEHERRPQDAPDVSVASGEAQDMPPQDAVDPPQDVVAYDGEIR